MQGIYPLLYLVSCSFNIHKIILSYLIQHEEECLTLFMQMRLQSLFTPLFDQLLPLTQKIIEDILHTPLFSLGKRVRTNRMFFSGYPRGNVNRMVCLLFNIWKVKANEWTLSLLYVPYDGHWDCSRINRIFFLDKTTKRSASDDTTVERFQQQNAILEKFLDDLPSLFESINKDWKLLKRVEDFNYIYPISIYGHISL